MSHDVVIQDFPDYTINREGVVRSRLTGRTSRPYFNGRYYQIALRKGGVKAQPGYHRVLAGAFIPNPDNHPVINHIDGDPTNNRLDNLEWCTQQENAEKANAKEWRLVSPEGEHMVVYNLAKFCKERDLHWGNLRGVCAGLRNSCQGWRTY